MRLNHFFENMVRREEIASAYLATLLDYDPDFREAFLRVALDEPTFVDHEVWKVRVEEDRVDVTLESETTFVLIEDKIASGAKQVGQLARYYLGAVGTRPAKRIVAVYLAPRGIGMDEVERVRQAEPFVSRASDIARHVSWESISEVVASQVETGTSWFASTGMEAIDAAIELAHQEKYPATGDRMILRQVMDNAHSLLASRIPGIQLGRWSARDVEEILSNGTPVTMWLDVVFEVEPEAPFLPVGVFLPDGVHVVIRSMFKLAGRVKRTSVLGRRWDQLVRSGPVEVPGIGRHELQPTGWFVRSEVVVTSPEGVALAVANTGLGVLEYLNALTSAATDSADRQPN